MSWFKKTPRAKAPVKHLPHHRHSPTAQRLLKETQQTGPSKSEKKSENRDNTK